MKTLETLTGAVLVLLLILLILAGCYKKPETKGQYEDGTEETSGHFVRVFWEGHNYIKYTKSHLEIFHDPECPCEK